MYGRSGFAARSSEPARPRLFLFAVLPNIASPSDWGSPTRSIAVNVRLRGKGTTNGEVAGAKARQRTMARAKNFALPANRFTLRTHMEFRILGPIEVWSEGRQLRLGGVKQRALLAVLLLHRNEVVSVDRLIDELWEDDPPATAVKTAQVHVSQLRKTLGRDQRGNSGEILVTQSPGYLLRVEADELDADRFERLADEGRRALRSGEPEYATRLLLEALSLWRGSALADFSGDPFAQIEAARLEEARVYAIEDRIDADLALGRHQVLIGELEALIQAHPVRERLRGQLMLALYRSDRQAEALAAYQDARRMLDEELGLEPSESLQRLEHAILVHDPSLDAPDVPDVEPAPPRAARFSRRLSRRGLS